MRKKITYILFFLILSLIVTGKYIGSKYSLHSQKQSDNSSLITKGELRKIAIHDNLFDKKYIRESIATSSRQIKPKSQAPTNSSDMKVMLETALSGDIVSVLDFQNKMLDCRLKDTLLRSAEQKVAMINKSSKVTGAPILSTTDNAIVKIAKKRKNECDIFYGKNMRTEIDEAVSDWSKEKISNLIESEAESGNSVARFLYAVRGPTDREAFIVGPPIMDYEEQARIYTELNKVDNVNLYLLAMGLSYSNGSYFTPKHVSLGKAYLLATKLCGLNHSLIDQQLETLSRLDKLRLLIQKGEDTPDDEIVFLSRLIANEYCPSV